MRIYQAQRRYVQWLRAARDLSPHTLRAYEGDVLAFGQHVGDRAMVQGIDRECLATFVETLKDSGLAPPSIRRRVAGVRGLCRWLLAQQLLEEDPLIGLTLPSNRRRALPRVIPAHELDRLFVYLRGAACVANEPQPVAIRTRPHQCTTLLGVALMLATGVRVHELVGITCDDVDVQSNTIRVLGKGRRERQVFLPNSWLLELTAIYIRVRSELTVAHPRLLFSSAYEPLSTQTMRARLGKAAEAAGLSLRVTPHMLRHTAATQLMEAGVDIRYIQRLLGHASLATTELYTHVSDKELRRVVMDADTLERYYSDN